MYIKTKTCLELSAIIGRMDDNSTFIIVKYPPIWLLINKNKAYFLPSFKSFRDSRKIDYLIYDTRRQRTSKINMLGDSDPEELEFEDDKMEIEIEQLPI